MSYTTRQLEEVPSEIYREYLSPYLSQRERINASLASVSGVSQAELSRLSAFPNSRLVKYIEDFPDSRDARRVLAARDQNKVYNIMLDIDSPLIIDWFPDQIDETFQKALEQKKGKIAVKLIAKYGLERFLPLIQAAGR